MIRNNISEVTYSVQTVIDEKNNLPIDYKVTNETDTNALNSMLRRTKKILGTSCFTALYDKGYHTGSEIKKAVEMGVDIMVATPGPGAFAPDENYNFEKFIYNESADTYTCPQQQILTTNNQYYVKNKEHNGYRVKKYSTIQCKRCPALHLCTKNRKGKTIERSEYQSFIEINKQNIARNPAIYKKRQAIVEHPYGTIKRQWGYDYIISKTGMKRASADVGFIFIAYNLRRLMNIIDKKEFKSYLKRLASSLFTFLTLMTCRLLKDKTSLTKESFFIYDINRPYEN